MSLCVAKFVNEETALQDQRKLSTAAMQSHNHQNCVAHSPITIAKFVAYVGSGVPMGLARLYAAFVVGLYFAFHVMTVGASAEPRFMRVHGQAAPPYGFLQFCRAYQTECMRQTFRSRRFEASPARLSELDQVNRHVNASVIPATDDEVYGVEEYWTFPGAMGDCEDYVVLKRRILMNRGWPAGSLLITVVMDEHGEGHAVLTARTAQGDFVLDNKVSEVKLWTQTPYRYVMRQSYINPKVWMSLDPRATASPQALAGLRTR